MSAGGDRRKARSRECPHVATKGIEDGFTLIEVLVAFLLLMIVIVPMAYLMNTIIGQAAGLSQQSTAHQIAESQLEQATNLPPSLIGTTQTTTQTVGNLVYTVKTSSHFATTDGATLCSAGAQPQVVTATVQVSWSNQSVFDTTQFNPNSQILNPAQGFLALPVYGNSGIDRNLLGFGSRISAIPVTITGGSVNETVTPDLSGCIYVELPVPDGVSATYNVSLGNPSGFATAFTGYPFETAAPVTKSETIPSQSINFDAAGVSFDEGSTVTPVTAPAVTAIEDGMTCLSGSAACATGGEDSAGGVLFTGSGSTWQEFQVPGTKRLVSEACATTTLCFAIGANLGGPVVVQYNPNGGAPTVVLASVPGAGLLTSIHCNSTMCVAAGVNSTGQPVAVTYLGGTWGAGATVLPLMATISQVGCAASSCVATGTTLSGQVGYLVFSGGAWSAATLFPAAEGIAGVTQLACIPASCLLTATATGGPAPPVFLGYQDGSPGTMAAVTAPIGGLVAGNQLSQLSCVAGSPALCLALVAPFGGPPAAGPETVAFSYAGTSWSAGAPVSFPSSVVSAASLTCVDTTHCFAAAGVGSSSSVLAYTTSPTASWASILPSSTPAPISVSGIGCTSVATSCYVAGLNPVGLPEVVADQAAVWTSTGLTGAIATSTAPVSHVDIEDASGAHVVQLATPPPALPLFFPNETGYYMWADNGSACPLPLGIWLTPVATTPGGSVTASPGMGLLDVQVTNGTTGGQIPNRTVTAQRTSPCGGDNPFTFTTGLDGVASIGALPGTYTLTVPDSPGPGSTVVTVQVSQLGSWAPASITVTG